MSFANIVAEARFGARDVDVKIARIPMRSEDYDAD